MTAIDREVNDTGVRWHWGSFDSVSAAELYAVMCLRQQVFIVEQACIYLDADGQDPHCLHGRATDRDGNLLAYARLVPPGRIFGKPSIGRVLVAAAHRGKGLAETLMRQAIERSRVTYPAPAIRISAQAYLQRFYERLGFVVMSGLYDDAGIPHLDMTLDAPVAA